MWVECKKACVWKTYGALKNLTWSELIWSPRYSISHSPVLAVWHKIPPTVWFIYSYSRHFFTYQSTLSACNPLLLWWRQPGITAIAISSAYISLLTKHETCWLSNRNRCNATSDNKMGIHSHYIKILCNVMVLADGLQISSMNIWPELSNYSIKWWSFVDQIMWILGKFWVWVSDCMPNTVLYD